MKRFYLLFFLLLSAGLTITSDGAYGQINREYMRQEREQHRCEFQRWPKAQYKSESVLHEFKKQDTIDLWANSANKKELLPHEVRIRVEDDQVLMISFAEKCRSELIGYVDSDFVYSPTKITHFSIVNEELIGYYKHPLKAAVSKRVYTKRLQSDIDSNNTNRGRRAGRTRARHN